MWKFRYHFHKGDDVVGTWRMKLVVLLAVMSTIGIIAIIPYELTFMQGQPLPEGVPEGLSPTAVIAINSTVQALYIFVLILFGLRMQARTGLRVPLLEGIVYNVDRPQFSKRWFGISVGVAALGSVLVIVLDLFLFHPLIDVPLGESGPAPVWWQGLLASFYGGITEEVMLRLFGMTLIVWILAKVTKRRGAEVPASFYYVAIVLTALLFGLGHLPATAQIFGGLSGVLVVRAIVLNGILGLWFGYLYWKRGLEYAIMAHFAADIVLHVIIAPLI